MKNIKSFIYLIFILLVFYCCEKHKQNKFKYIEVYNFNRSDSVLFVIKDTLIINSFEKEISKAKKKEYLKNPSVNQYYLKCYSKDSIMTYFIANNLILQKTGISISDKDFVELLKIE